uniref:THAP domain-containing protein 11 n=1 Tax=Cairina moschata TaxID=8855 RepID=A0A8C3CM64_CAIMO
MPGFTCCVPGCYNNSHRDKALHFYTFPKDEELRRLWLKNVSRAGCERIPELKSALVLCSFCFLCSTYVFVTDVSMLSTLARIVVWYKEPGGI